MNNEQGMMNVEYITLYISIQNKNFKYGKQKV